MINGRCVIRRRTCLIIGLGVIVLMTSSCTPLRKKFTRKKKENREADSRFIPVLDPIDYPPKITLSKDKYKHHYSLWKVWDKDLLQNIEMDSSEKRQKYLITQSVTHLDEMIALLDGAKRTRLEELTQNYQSVLQEYDKPASARNKNSLKRKIERSGKEVRADYTPKALESYWQNQQSTGAADNNE